MSSRINERNIVFWSIVVSLIIHLSSVVIFEPEAEPEPSPQGEYINFRLQSASKQPKPKKKEPQPEDPEAKKIVEVIQNPTDAPEEDYALGQVDHRAVKRRRVDRTVDQNKKDPGSAEQKRELAAAAAELPAPLAGAVDSLLDPADSGEISIGISETPRRDVPDTVTPETPLKYSDLVASSMNSLLEQSAALGYQDLLSDGEVADTIDLNTRQYRYIGYFSSLRKAIASFWSYPGQAARRGWSGTVVLRFTILNDGSVSEIEVIDSSGYRVLDKAIVAAINHAAPFAPIPEGFGQEFLNISASFIYTLRGS